MASKKPKLMQTGAETDSRGERTRRGIKRAIARLASKKEVADITLADVCAATKLTTGAIYFHFGGRDEAIEEMVIDEIQSLYAERMKDDGSSFGAFVSSVIAGSTRYHQRMKRMPRAISVIINTRPRAYAAWLEARRPLVARLERLIVDARREAGLTADAAPYLAHFILNSIEDLAMDVFQWQNPTLAPFASDLDDWNARQTALWSWAILAPVPTAVRP